MKNTITKAEISTFITYLEGYSNIPIPTKEETQQVLNRILNSNFTNSHKAEYVTKVKKAYFRHH